MKESSTAQEFLAASSVDAEVFELRPDYRAMRLVVDGIDPRSASAMADDMIAVAEAHARMLLADRQVEDLPHIAAWREAYRAFGAKPQRTRNSLEALTRRASEGLPRVNALTDVYNAISVLHQVPLGGEDFDLYDGPAQLVRAGGEEDFATVAGGEQAIDHPKPGEVIWQDDAGVTCRRWNWRQGPRTALSDETRTAFFILDALEPMDDDSLNDAADALIEGLSSLGAEVSVSRRLIGAP
jgi:DNA/RNA-binding domain of Phe-tRNA-synthetase-like protein